LVSSTKRSDDIRRDTSARLSNNIIGRYCNFPLLAFYLWANTPVTAIWLLGVLLGIELISEGAALGRMAWQARKS
jgi:hypothetical protein